MMTTAPKQPIEIRETRILIVEGIEDKLCFEELIKHLHLQNIQVLDIGGKKTIRLHLQALALAPGFTDVTELVVVRDADTNPRAALDSIRGALQAAGLPVPLRSWTPSGVNPRVGIMILPAASTTGMLEDIFLNAASQDPAISCVDEYIQCLQNRGIGLPRNLSKARMQAFLASRVKAGLRLGESAQAGYWQWGDPAFEHLRDFLLAMYSSS